MKYAIHGFSQKVAVDYGLDADHLLILRCLIDSMNPKGAGMKIIEGVRYYLVDYKVLLESLPILKLTRDQLCRKFQELYEAGMLEHQYIRQDRVSSYWKTGVNFLSLTPGGLVDA